MLRRASIWVAVAIVVAAVGLWLISRVIWLEWSAGGRGVSIGLRSGWLYAGNLGGIGSPGLHILQPTRPQWWNSPSVYWGRDTARMFLWSVRTPLWLVAAPAAFYLTAVFLLGRVRRGNRRRKGLCIACGYDRASALGPCPECGRREL